MPIKTLAIAAAAFAMLTGAASAQDVIIEDDAAVIEEPAPIEDDATVAVTRPIGPRVYGWPARPADCGTFRYWNGVRCVDARDNPPVP